MNKKNLTRVAGLSAAAMLALSGMAMAETTESALVKGGALNLRETAKACSSASVRASALLSCASSADAKMQLTPIKTVSSRQNIRFIIVKRSFFRKRYDLPMLLYRKNPPLYTLEMCGKCKLCAENRGKRRFAEKYSTYSAENSRFAPQESGRIRRCFQRIRQISQNAPATNIRLLSLDG